MNYTTKLYHWTHKKNLSSILCRGLYPDRARGKDKAVWLCEAKAVPWALVHVATGQRWAAGELVLLCIDPAYVKKVLTGIPGAFRCREVIRPEGILGVKLEFFGLFVPHVSIA